MVRYEAVQDRWWELALQRREGYIGKRKVLNGFFGGIQRAGPKTTGRGEQAVPTTGTYRACKRVFGAQATVLTDEFRTTCVDRLSPEGEVLYPVIRGLRFCPETRSAYDR
jgi:hypothetical protein